MPTKLLRSIAALAALLATIVVFVDPAFAAGGTLKDPGVLYAATNTNITFNGTDLYTGESRVLEVEGGSKPDECSHGDEPDDGEIGTPPDGEPSGACFTVQVTLNGGATNGNMTLNGASGGGHPSGVEILGATPLPNPVFNFFGTRDEVNAALKTLTFDPDPDYETSYPTAGDPTFVNLDIRDGNGDEVLFVDEDGDAVNGGDIVLDLRIEQENDGPTLEIEALNQPIEVAAGGDVTLTNTDGTPDFQDDVFVTDPDLDDDELDDVMLMVAWLDGGGGQADFSLSPSVSPSCVSSLEEIMLQDDDIDVLEPLEDRCDVLPGPIDLSLVPADIPGSLSFTSSTQDQQAIAALARYNGLPDQEDVIEDIFSYIEFDAMPTGDCDCTITVVLSDLGNNGLPLTNVVPGVVLPDPGFAIETIDFKVRDAENDPPVVTADPAGPTAVDELTSVPLSFTVEDPDAEGDLTITGISVTGGSLTGAPAVGTNGSPASLTAALSGMTFDANETTADPGLGSVTVSVEDNGWGAAEDPSDSESASATATFTIEEDGLPDSDPNPEDNDPPVLTTPASLYAIEGVATPFLPATIGVTDPDSAGDDLTMTITPTGGTTSDDGVTTGTLAELNVVLDGLTYTATQDVDFDDAVGSVTIEVSDNGHNPDLGDPADVGTDTAVIDITIEDDELPPEVNDPPVLTVPASIDAIEGLPFGFNPAAIGVTDPDAGPDDLTLTITSGAGGTTNQEGVHTGTLAELNALLDGLEYTPEQDVDATDDATSILIEVNDNGHNPDSDIPAEEGTDTATVAVAVDDDDVQEPDVNDPPVITLPATGTVVEGIPAGFDSATIGVDDPDAGTDDLTMTITSVGGTTADDGSTTGTLVELNAILDDLEFTATDDADFDDEVGSITIVVNDNGHNPDSNLPADEGVDTAVIDLAIEDDDEAPPEVNDPPELTAPVAINAIEGLPFGFNPAAIGLTDPDAADDDLTLTITSSGEGSTNEEGTHTGTLAELNTILDGLEFTPDHDADAIDDVASILIEVTDNGHNPDSNLPADEGTDSATISVAIDDDEAPPEPNDPPTLTAPGAQTVVVGGTVTFTGALRITVDDPDAAAGDLTLHLEVTGGVLTPATADVTGTLAELQAHLDSLVFTAGAVPGNGSISITVDDQGNTGTGGPLTASATIDLTITAAPVDPVEPDDPDDPTDTTTTTATSTTTSTVPPSTSTTDPAAVAGNGEVASSGTTAGTLPRTGTSLLVALTGALALTALGSVLVVGARRRSSR